LRLNRFILILIALLSPGFRNLSYSDIYKCVDENGTLVFSDERCGEESQVIIKKPSLAEKAEAIDSRLHFFNAKEYLNFWIAEKAELAPFRKRLEQFARQIGQLLYPDFPFFSAHTYRKTAYVYFRCARSQDGPTYQIKIGYHYAYNEDTGYTQATVKTIETLKNDKDFDPPCMQHLKRFKKIRTGRWVRREL
jgi:hypothetical protein